MIFIPQEQVVYILDGGNYVKQSTLTSQSGGGVKKREVFTIAAFTVASVNYPGRPMLSECCI